MVHDKRAVKEAIKLIDEAMELINAGIEIEDKDCNTNKDIYSRLRQIAYDLEYGIEEEISN